MDTANRQRTTREQRLSSCPLAGTQGVHFLHQMGPTVLVGYQLAM